MIVSGQGFALKIALLASKCKWSDSDKLHRPEVNTGHISEQCAVSQTTVRHFAVGSRPFPPAPSLGTPKVFEISQTAQKILKTCKIMGATLPKSNI
jgi:hypothetical protein